MAIKGITIEEVNEKKLWTADDICDLYMKDDIYDSMTEEKRTEIRTSMEKELITCDQLLKEMGGD